MDIFNVQHFVRYKIIENQPKWANDNSRIIVTDTDDIFHVSNEHNILRIFVGNIKDVGSDSQIANMVLEKDTAYAISSVRKTINLYELDKYFKPMI